MIIITIIIPTFEESAEFLCLVFSLSLFLSFWLSIFYRIFSDHKVKYIVLWSLNLEKKFHLWSGADLRFSWGRGADFQKHFENFVDLLFR